MLLLALALSACNQRNEVGSTAAAQAKDVPFPSYSMEQLLELDKSERAELAQRCQGIQNKACSDFQSESFKKRDELAKTFCDMAEEQRLSKGASNAQPRKVKCNLYY